MITYHLQGPHRLPIFDEICGYTDLDLKQDTKFWEKHQNFIEENKADICASVQFTLVEILLKKVKRAMREKKCTQIAIAGGVSANSGLREKLSAMGVKLHSLVTITDLLGE